MSSDESNEETNVGEEQDRGLQSPVVIDKYTSAATIANRVLTELMGMCVEGASVFDLCGHGDKLINQYVGETFAKVKLKGVAFPTSISVNNCAGNFSPLTIDDNYVLVNNDLVKIDLGVQFDGYASTVAHTIIVGPRETAVTGKVADVICAAYYAGECAIRLLRPGKKNSEITNAIQRVATVFGVKPVQGVLSHEIKKFSIDGKKVIINRPEVDQIVEEFTFEANQAYSIDIVMSTGEGKTRQENTKTSIYKRNTDVNYSLKLKSSRNLVVEIKKKFASFPFNLRSMEDVRSRLGITELVNHNLVSSYPVLFERSGEYIAQFKFTVLVLPTTTKRLNEGFDLPWVTSDNKIESDQVLEQIMAMSIAKKAKKKKPKKKTNPT
jgi:curved DNA binding protein